MTLALEMVTTDSPDALAHATWWAEQVGGQVDDSYGGEFVLVTGGGLPLRLAFQRVAEPTPGKNRIHLDLSADDPGAEVKRLTAAGATVVGHRGEEGFRWVTLLDPFGIEFCIAGAETSEDAGGADHVTGTTC